MNQVILMGRICKDIEIKDYNGVKVVSNTIAVDRYVKDKENQTDFVAIKAFNKTAELLDKYFKKGSKILVEGNIKTGSYEKEGKKIYTTDVIIDKVHFVDSKQNSTSGKNDVELDDEDLPF